MNAGGRIADHRAALEPLGEIGTSETSEALAAARGKRPAPVQQAVVDELICAERLVAARQRGQAIRLLESLTEAPRLKVGPNYARREHD